MQALAPVGALLLSVAILLTGNGLQGVLLPVRAALEAFNTFEIGLIASCYFAGFAAGCVFGAKLIQRVGHIRAFAGMTALASTTALAHGLWLWPMSWWTFRFVSGFCFAVLYVVIESWLNERSTRETRGTVLSAYMIINLTVLTAGQMMLPLYDPGEVMLFGVASILVSLAALPVAMTGAMAPAPVAGTKLDVKRLFQVSPAGVVGCIAVGLANGAFWALAPVFGQQKQFDDTGIALFMSAAVIGGALGQWPLGHLSDRIDRRLVIMLAAALCGGISLVIVFGPSGSTTMLTLLSLGWGACAFPLYSLSVAHANDFAQPDEFVQVSSGLLLAYAGGAIAGPLVASGLMGVLGPTGLYAYVAVVYGALIAFVAVRMRMREQVAAEEQVTFSEALAAATTVSPVFDEVTQDKLEHEHEEDPAAPDDQVASGSGSADPPR